MEFQEPFEVTVAVSWVQSLSVVKSLQSLSLNFVRSVELAFAEQPMCCTFCWLWTIICDWSRPDFPLSKKLSQPSWSNSCATPADCGVSSVRTWRILQLTLGSRITNLLGFLLMCLTYSELDSDWYWPTGHKKEPRAFMKLSRHTSYACMDVMERFHAFGNDN